MSQHDDSSAPTQVDFHNAQTLPDAAGSPVTSAAGAAPAMTAAPRRYNFFLDILRGIFLGAYAVDDLRAPGLLVWIIEGFIPGVGTLAAVRDAYYSIEVHEWGGLVFNLVGLLPFMKGFANIIEVSQLRRLKHVAHATHQVIHVVRQERKLAKVGRVGKLRKLRKGSGKLSAVVTGAAHDAGAVSILMADRPVPGRNRAAWPALLLGVVSALVLPVLMLVVLDVIAGAAYFSYHVPLAVAVGSGALGLAASVGIAMLAHHARTTARLLRGRPFSRGFIAALAVGLAWLGMLASVLILATIVYLERGALPHF